MTRGKAAGTILLLVSGAGGCVSERGEKVAKIPESATAAVSTRPAAAVRRAAPASAIDLPDLTVEERTVVRIAQTASPSVVSIVRRESSGSGIIVREDGIVLTNAHVLGAARVVQVGLADGRLLQGEVLGRDPSVDVGVVRVNARDLPAATLGDSDQLQVGQTAIAIGNPLGLERTVTSGVVSAVNRSPIGFGLDALIQTDAAISPGN
ncbi:MAG TPA: trypsin-like peptidase domain-containing protein, partial [Gemmatimonadales bacterium]|nr:trypsin-like peptidase domain-containing protein [Gemmatimonadales bacterium]